MNLQEEIVDSVSKIKDRVRRLKEECDALLDEAKQKIEKLLLE